ncbi:hypothetical protein HS088_TW17G00217 [Tripterygium wilfordii]|uniref:Mitochondrial transcription termination factor family protein n=1 Tax=Tripterygium wilfordii TaxID=458696 RepID=A0A7J7CFP1_TRIWF|nr:uncharacterized protein LOC119982660 [Tripterygium wilfordii]KAF5732687.1 hypothetical protein HS088_TW17G00217 [Tripterygium wilfordii]
MFALIRKSSCPISNGIRVLVNPIPQLRFLEFCAPKFSSAAEKDGLQHSFIVSYLVNSCFLTLESAKSLSKKVHFETPKNPDSVLNLLKKYGFTSDDIAKIVRARPEVLTYDAKKTLLPKIEFFLSKHISSSDLAMVFVRGPTLFCLSLEKVIIPCYDFLKSVLVNDKRVFSSLKRSPRLASSNVDKILAPNVSVMRNIGLPQSSISKLLSHSPNVFVQKPEKFDKVIRKVLSMGLNPLSTSFCDAIEIILQLSESTWEHKMKLYRSWGWSDDDIWAAFKKKPRVMAFSDNKISKTMHFLVNIMGWQSSNVAKSSYVLYYSLEKRIIPRCSVLKFLALKGLIGEDASRIPYIFQLVEEQFLDKYVTKYEKQVPQILSVYQGKVCPQELGLRYEEVYF